MLKDVQNIGLENGSQVRPDLVARDQAGKIIFVEVERDAYKGAPRIEKWRIFIPLRVAICTSSVKTTPACARCATKRSGAGRYDILPLPDRSALAERQPGSWLFPETEPAGWEYVDQKGGGMKLDCVTDVALNGYSGEAFKLNSGVQV